MKLFYKIGSYGLGIGLVHSGLTPLFYDHVSLDALWFASTGIMLLFLGLLNLTAGRIWQVWLFNICIPANMITLLFCITAEYLKAQTETQVYLMSIITLAVTVGSIGCRWQIKSAAEPYASPAC